MTDQTSFETFNASLAKKLKSLKKDLGATNIRQGYKGTGSKSHRRQIWVSFPNASIDIWLEEFTIKLGGVCGTGSGLVKCHDGRSTDAIYQEVLEKLAIYVAAK